MKQAMYMLMMAILMIGVTGSLAQAHGRYHRWHGRRWHHHGLHRHHGHPRRVERIFPGEGAGTGMASWYRARTGGLTAAHRFWPFGTRVLVTNRSNGRSVVVRIDDRGPFIRGRIIDLNRPSAVAIGVTGVSPVVLRRL